MSAITYTFTPDVVSKPLTLTAAPEGLTVIEGAKPLRITWSDVMRVELGPAPTKFNRERYRCRLSTRSGKMIEIDSTSCRGAGDFVAQSEEYRRFIEAIHEDVRTHGKNVVFSAGGVGMRYVFNLVVLVVAVAALSAGLALAGVSYSGPTAFVHLILVAAGALAAWKWLARSRPSIYDPKSIPAALLPKPALAQQRASKEA